MEHSGHTPLPPPTAPHVAVPSGEPQFGAPSPNGDGSQPEAGRPVPSVAALPWQRPLRPGRLTGTWRILMGLVWSAAFFAYAAVWQASVQLGIGLWWIGPRAQPTPALLRLVPFLVCLAMVLCVIYGVPRLPLVGIALSAGMLAFAVPDLSRSTSLAVTELLIAATLLAANAAALTGMARRSSG